jgi:two-component system sensor histidine kinase VicK
MNSFLGCKRGLPSDMNNERTDVYYGTETVLNTELQFFSKSNEKIDTCMNYTRPQLAIEIKQIKNAFIEAKNRGVKLRYITEITSENISFCKELIKIVGELRHLDGIKGNFMLSESEYLAPLILFRKGEIASQIIYSNIKEVIEHQQYVFDTLWNKSIAAEKRIKQIEEGVEPIETKVLENKEQIFNHMKSVIENASERSVCSSIGAMQLVYNNFFEEYKKIVDKHRKEGRGKGVRWLTSIIDKDSIDLVKIFLNAGIQVRHVKNLTPMNFAVDNKYFYATIEKMEEGKMMESLLASNEPAYVKHFNCIFEDLWSKGIDAKDRIIDIKKGIEITNVEIIENPKESINRAYDISLSAKEELLVAFPTTNAFRRNVRTGMSMLLLKERSAKNNVKLRILTPLDNQIMQTIEELKRILPQVDVRAIDESIDSRRITIVLADRKECLIVEIKDDTKNNLYDAAGLSIYSNSNSIVSSYLSIFESLWKQTELYEQIKEAHEQLKVHDKMQKEFINVAAHELRTPIQPILGLTEFVYSKITDAYQRELLDAVIRNAKRLQQLTEDILDITRIESKSLKLNKELFNLDDVISTVVEEYKNQIEKEGNDIELVYATAEDNIVVLIDADRARITQVIFNLLSNAIKFTKKGTITIKSEKEDHHHHHHHQKEDIQQEVIVSVKDTGEGIDHEILPRLFSKFATKSYHGTGLGLFISKSIVQAHSGRIWAENNTDGKGATFYFSLPLSNRDI